MTSRLDAPTYRGRCFGGPLAGQVGVASTPVLFAFSDPTHFLPLTVDDALGTVVKGVEYRWHALTDQDATTYGCWVVEDGLRQALNEFSMANRALHWMAACFGGYLWR